MNPRVVVFVAATALLSLLASAAAQSALSGGGLLAIAGLVLLAPPALIGLALLVRAAWMDGREARKRGEQAARLGKTGRRSDD